MLSSSELYPQELNFYFPQRHVHHKQKLWDFYLPIMASLTLESTGRIFFSTSSIGPGLWAIFSFRSSANRALFSFIWVACSEGSAKVSKRIYWFKYSVPTFPQFHDKHHCLCNNNSTFIKSQVKYYSENSQINKHKYDYMSRCCSSPWSCFSRNRISFLTAIRPFVNISIMSNNKAVNI